MSDEIKDSFKGKTGNKGNFKISNEYPYLIFSPESYNFLNDDTFELKSSSGGYSEEMKYADSEKFEGYIVLWFPMPLKGKKYSLKVKHSVVDDSYSLKEYYIFEDEVLTFRDEEKISDQKLLIRGKS